MKKLFISLLAIAATINAMAIDYEAKATFKLTSTSAQTCEATIAQIAGSVSKYCSEMNMTGRKVAIYAVANSKNYQIYAANELEGAVLGVMTDAATEYTITFSDVIGSLYLVDAVAGKTVAITEGGSYAFTAEASKTVTDRFSITKSLPYAFINNNLVITEAVGDVNITPFTYENGKRVLGTPETVAAPVNKTLEGGYSLVEYTTGGGAERAFVVNANPTVVPADN